MKDLLKRCGITGLAVIFVILVAGIFTTCDLFPEDEPETGKIVDTYDGLLGSGYDIINGRFFNSEDLKPVVLDTNKMAADGLIIVDSRNQRLTRTDHIAGETFSSYMQNTALNISTSASTSIFTFKGSVSADFGLSTSSKTEEHNSFAKTTTTLIKQRDSVRPYNVSDIRNKYLLDSFKNSWLMNNSISPEELIHSFGTHIILLIDLGGRLEMSYVIQNKFEGTTRQSESQIKAKLQTRFTTISTGVSTNNNTENTFNESEINETIRSFGGSVGIDLTTFDKARDNYERWAESIEDSNNLTLINAGKIGDRMQMLPIWELIDPAWTGGQARRDAIEAEFNNQLDLFGSDILEMQDDYYVTGLYIKDIYTAEGTNYTNAMNNLRNKVGNNTFIKVLEHHQELNFFNQGQVATPAGNAVAIGYTYTSNPDEAIRNLVIRRGSNIDFTINGAQYIFDSTKQVNLNSGARNRENNAPATPIYLFYTRDPSAGVPLKDLLVEINKDGKDVYNTPRPHNAGWTTRVCLYEDGIISSGVYNINFETRHHSSAVYLWMQR